MRRLEYYRQLYQSANGRWVLVSERPASVQEAASLSSSQRLQQQAMASGRWLRELWWFHGPNGWVKEFAWTYPPNGRSPAFASY